MGKRSPSPPLPFPLSPLQILIRSKSRLHASICFLSYSGCAEKIRKLIKAGAEYGIEARLSDIAAFIRKVFLPPIQELVRAIGNRSIPKDFPHVTTNYHGQPAQRVQTLDNILSLDNSEGVFVQSTMSLFAEIRPGRTWFIRLLFLLAPPLLKYGWPPGNFAGVYSLHSFRFAIIDGGKRLWFMSNYNGGAENYFSDFIDKLNWGINTAYTSCKDYPEGGMTQTDAFAYWIRERQFPALVYYSAYPRESVLKLIQDRETSRTLGTDFDREVAERLLSLF